MVGWFSHHFARSSTLERAKQYIQGLYASEKSNMESMEEAVSSASEQSLHYLINDADWDHDAVLGDIALKVNMRLGGSKRTCLCLDETYFVKRGEHSAGVARQHNGRIGKIDNCQVGVFSALCRDNYAVPIAAKLYLPASWTSNQSRMNKCKVPLEAQRFQTKTEIAIDQVKNAIRSGLQFEWTAVDAGYGKCPVFHREMMNLGVTYMADVHCSQRVYLADPSPSKKKRADKFESAIEPIRVDKWLEQSDDWWTYVTVRNGTKGRINIRCKRLQVWLWDTSEANGRQVTLLISQMPNGTDTKFSITNAVTNLPTQTIAYYQRQRFWIEQAFKDGKSEVGMHQYQVRSWHGWHRHMALCSMALLFMLELKIADESDLPLLSAHDARDLLALEFMAISTGTQRDAISEVILTRHRRRLRDIYNAYRKQGLPVPIEYVGRMTE